MKVMEDQQIWIFVFLGWRACNVGVEHLVDGSVWFKQGKDLVDCVCSKCGVCYLETY